jgi:hypothetical protein
MVPSERLIDRPRVGLSPLQRFSARGAPSSSLLRSSRTRRPNDGERAVSYPAAPVDVKLPADAVEAKDRLVVANRKVNRKSSFVARRSRLNSSIE